VLASGSLDCTTMVWDVTTGKVLRHSCTVTHTLPEICRKEMAKHDEDPPKVAYAFKHHVGAVSALVATKAAVLSGSWDQTLCISYLPVYRERWNDTRAVAILKERCKELRAQVDEIVEAAKPRRPVGRAMRLMERLEAELQAAETECQRREQRLRNSLYRCRKFLRVTGKDVGKVMCIAFQKLEGGAYGLFAGYADGNVRQWDVNGSKVACVFMAHQGSSCTSVALGVGRLYTGGADGMIRVWDLIQSKLTGRTQQNMIDLAGHTDGVTCLKVCGNLLLSSSHDLTVRAWNLLSMDPEMKPNAFPEGSTEGVQALRLYDKDEVIAMIEEEERMRRFQNVDSANQQLYSGVMTAVKLKRARARAQRALSGEIDLLPEDAEKEEDEEEVEEGDEFLKMVHADMLELTECLPMLSKEVDEGMELAESFLKNLRNKLKGEEEEKKPYDDLSE